MDEKYHGDRPFFDPTKNEVPLGNLQNVVELLGQKGGYVTQWPTIHLTRKGWSDVRLSNGSKEVEKFRLEAGDRVSLEVSDQVRAELVAKWRESVTLKVDDYPYAKTFGTMVDGKAVEASIPTLIQALVDTQVPLHRNCLELSPSKTLDSAILSKEYGPFDPFSLLPHPELASIRSVVCKTAGRKKSSS